VNIKELLNIKQPKSAISENLEVPNFIDNDIVFPEMINIGTLKSKNDTVVPALFPLTHTNGICFLSHNDNKVMINNALQQMALRLVLSFPAGMSKFTFIDPTGLGQNFKFLSNLSSKIIGDKILTETKEIERAINELKVTTTNIIQKILGYKYQTLEEYNQTAGELAEPYNFLFLANCPRKLTRENCEQLLSLLESGHKAGIFVIMSLDTTFQPKSNYDIDPFQFIKAMPTIYEVEKRFFVKNFAYEEIFNKKYKFILNTNIPKSLDTIIDTINTQITKTKRVEVDLTRALTIESLWKQDSSENLTIPIGKINQTEVQNFVLGSQANVYHSLIGGMTGSGKTVLLHNIICNASWLYSPNELQFVLMDYKEGTEFKAYENLPHVKVLSINSEREFGLSVFEYLRSEIERRGDLFKKYNVANLGAYRQASKAKLPRILVIVDEFQVLISNTDKLSKEVIELMDDLAKRGRSFGINMLLCTQTLGEAMIKGSTLSQLGLRIAMKLHPNDCHKILNKDNDLPIYFDKAGEAVYNTKNGLSEGNLKFQVGYMSGNKMNEIIHELQSIAKTAQIDSHKRFIFEGIISANIASNQDLNDKIKSNSFIRNDNFADIFIGEPAYLDEKHTSFRVRKQNESNVLITGQDTNSAVAIVYYSLWQLIKQSSQESKFYILDLFNIDSGFKELLNPLQQFSQNVVIGNKDLDIENFITEIANELTGRIQKEEQNKRIVLAIMDIQKARPLRKQGFTHSKVTEKLNAILKDGSAYGIHTFVYASNYNGLIDILDNKLISEFDTRIALKGGESSKILGGSIFENVINNNGIALVKSPYTKYEIDKVKIYSL
jgi:DNA segregation ATPase FtsK/SpoIIIE, S-DNA-T family